jgi:murein DD-endopeptidase MepM/ murein hydrolase activator NlpD
MSPIKYIRIALIIILSASALFSSETDSGTEILRLDSLSLRKNPTLTLIRSDVRKAITAVKGGRPAEELPELKVFSYKLKKKDTFWDIISSTSLDMDTLLTVNDLASPSDLKNRSVIYIPNIRGVVVEGKKSGDIEELLAGQRIRAEYVFRANRCDTLDKKFIFIPCGKITLLERSLFLGTAFLYPLKNGRKTSAFGTRTNPFNKKKHEFHSGIDIACRMNSDVMSARDGVVEFAGFNGGYGLLVIIRHEHGYHSYYGHLNRLKIKAGDRVAAGQVIANSGNTGRTTGPHLHFEIRRQNRPVNPAGLLRKG